MKIISFITEHQIIKKILEHLSLWEQNASRDLPNQNSSPENNELIYEPFYEDWPEYEEPYIVLTDHFYFADFGYSRSGLSTFLHITTTNPSVLNRTDKQYFELPQFTFTLTNLPAFY